MTFLPLVWALIWGLGEALRLTATGSDLQFTVKLEVLFACIEYEEQDTVWNVAGWLMTAPSLVRESYRRTAVFDALWIFHHVFEHSTLHNLMLPLEFLVNNPVLLELVDAHWDEYNFDRLEIGSYHEILEQEPWHGRITSYIMAHPYKTSGLTAISACWNEYLAPWEIHFARGFPSREYSQQWLHLPTLLKMIQACFQEPELVAIGPLGVPYSQEAVLLRSLFTKSDVLQAYVQIVECIRNLLNESGMQALWHGKVTYLALSNTATPSGHVVLILKDYFCAYHSEEYQFDLVQMIAVQENLRRPRPVYNDVLLDVTMRLVTTYHRGVVPFWTGLSERLLHWKGILPSMGRYSPPPEACGWRVASALFGEIKQFPVMSRWFTAPFVLTSEDGQVTTCHNLDCFIPAYVNILLSESRVFISTSGGNAFSEAPTNSLIWKAIARIIILGFVYYQRDVFHLSSETWDLFHNAPPEMDRWDQHFGNQGLSTIQCVFQAVGLLLYL